MACHLTREEQIRGGVASGRVRRQKGLAKLAAMTKLEVAQKYYRLGWHAGAACERRRWTGDREYLIEKARVQKGRAA